MNIKTIDARIEELKNQIQENEGRRTEVYSRIVGYYRSVKNWNKGKKEEFDIRKTFQVKCVPSKMEMPVVEETSEVMETEKEVIEQEKVLETPISEEKEVLEETPEVKSEVSSDDSQGDLFSEESESSSKFLFFFRQDCPNCPPVKAMLEECDLEGEAIDVDQEEGLKLAVENNVYTAPTVIFQDESGKEISRADNPVTLEEQLSQMKVAVTL